MSRLGRRAAWAVLAVVVAVALVVGATASSGPRTNAERTRDLAATIRCPACRGESVLDSNVPIAEAIRTEIATRFRDGETADEIRAVLVSRYGDDVLLTPPAQGVGALVWILPLVGVAAAAGGLVVAFGRWRADAPGAATDDDRRLVEAARRGSDG